jgi:hypothetical protein
VDEFQALLPGRASWFAAFFFGASIQTGAVAYVFARGILLATLFCLLALRLWIAGRRWHAVAAFALALLSKEECAAFPVFLILLHLSTSRDRNERRPIAAMMALSLAAVGRVAWLVRVSQAPAPAGKAAFHRRITSSRRASRCGGICV